MSDIVMIIVVSTCAFVSIASLLGILHNRNKLKKGIGLRALQFACLTIMLPLLIILTVIEVLPISTIAVVAGSIIGYAFASRENKEV